MFFGGFLSGLFAKLVAFVGAAILGLSAAPGGSATTHATTHLPTSVSTSGHLHSPSGSDTSVSGTVSTPKVPGIAGISSALAGLGAGVSSCVTSVLSSAGTVSSANASALLAQVTACVTSALNAAQLPGGSSGCASAIMSVIDSALAGKAPSFDIAACIPSGLPTTLPNLGSTGLGTSSSLPKLSDLPSKLSGLGTGVVSCVLNALTAAGSISSANASQLGTQVTGCVTSSLNSSQLPAGASSCVSAIMSSIEQASAGKTPSFDITDCIPSGEGSGKVGGELGFSGLSQLFSGGFSGFGPELTGSSSHFDK